MENTKMTSLTIARVKSVYKGSCIDNDLLMVCELSELPFPNSPRKMQCLFIALCLEGEAQYTVNAEQHKIEANDAMIISKGAIVNNYHLGKGFSGIGILLSDGFFKETVNGVHELSSLFLFSRKHPVFSLHADEVAAIKAYFYGIKRKADDMEHHFRKDVVRSMLKAMIYDISNAIYRIQESETKTSTRAENIFSKFIVLVEKNFRMERRVGWYGLQLGITPKYLSETVKQISNRTANEWIDYYVMLEAQALLKDSAISIKEITRMLNFPNQSFFGNFFKKHSGMSPTKYRKK